LSPQNNTTSQNIIASQIEEDRREDPVLVEVFERTVRYLNVLRLLLNSKTFMAEMAD